MGWPQKLEKTTGATDLKIGRGHSSNVFLLHYKARFWIFIVVEPKNLQCEKVEIKNFDFLRMFAWISLGQYADYQNFLEPRKMGNIMLKATGTTDFKPIVDKLQHENGHGLKIAKGKTRSGLYKFFAWLFGTSCGS